MAVRVVTSAHSTGTARHWDDFDEGWDFSVSDGHLTVFKVAPSDKLGIYAPGTWVRVTILEADQHGSAASS